METEKLHQIGRDIGLTGTDLAQFIKEGIQYEREKETAAREERKEERAWKQAELKAQEAKVQAEVRREEIKLRQMELKKESGEDKSSESEHNVKRRDDIDAYLQRFERFATSAGWPEDIWAISLASLLQGRALDIYHQLSQTDAGNYSELKSALLRGLTVLRKDSELSLEAERSLATLQDLEESADRYIEAHGHFTLRTPQQATVSSQSSAQQFGQVNEGSDRSPRKALSSPLPQVKCYICQKGGHKAWDCYFRPNINKSKVASTSATSGPTRKEAAAVTSQGAPSIAEHPQDDASEVVQVDPVGVIDDHGWIKVNGKGFRMACGGSGKDRHSKLITKPGEVEGHKVTVMRDNGCTTVLVKRSLVPNCKLTGKHCVVKMANSDVFCYPEAEITVKSPFYTGTTKAVCIPNPIHDLVIGNVPGVRLGDNYGKHTCGVMTRDRQTKERKQPELKVLAVSNMLNMTIKRAQQEDKTLDGVRKYAEEGKEFFRRKKNEFSMFILKRGVLYRKVKIGDLEREQLLVPSQCRSAVLDLAHSSIMGGHLATGKTKDRVMEKFFWPGITKDIERYCRSCDVCQRTVDKGKVQRAKLGKMPIIGEPFSRLAVDIVGPIEPRSSDGSRYILTVVDFATRYPEAVALQNIDTASVAEALVNIFSRVGIPREVLSDRGTQFTSAMMQEVYRLLSIQSITTTPYHAMCNGLVEKFNGTLKGC
nr:uncharacterized protein LOC113805282 [Penaeus vannamei]